MDPSNIFTQLVPVSQSKCQKIKCRAPTFGTYTRCWMHLEQSRLSSLKTKVDEAMLEQAKAWLFATYKGPSAQGLVAPPPEFKDVLRNPHDNTNKKKRRASAAGTTTVSSLKKNKLSTQEQVALSETVSSQVRHSNTVKTIRTQTLDENTKVVYEEVNTHAFVHEVQVRREVRHAFESVTARMTTEEAKWTSPDELVKFKAHAARYDSGATGLRALAGLPFAEAEAQHRQRWEELSRKFTISRPKGRFKTAATLSAWFAGCARIAAQDYPQDVAPAFTVLARVYFAIDVLSKQQEQPRSRRHQTAHLVETSPGVSTRVLRLQAAQGSIAGQWFDLAGALEDPVRAFDTIRGWSKLGDTYTPEQFKVLWEFVQGFLGEKDTLLLQEVFISEQISQRLVNGTMKGITLDNPCAFELSLTHPWAWMPRPLSVARHESRPAWISLAATIRRGKGRPIVAHDLVLLRQVAALAFNREFAEEKLGRLVQLKLTTQNQLEPMLEIDRKDSEIPAIPLRIAESEPEFRDILNARKEKAAKHKQDDQRLALLSQQAKTLCQHVATTRNHDEQTLSALQGVAELLLPNS